MTIKKPKLSFWQIWNMNVGFFGIQFSFGLQQTAINPIFSFLGAHHDELPLLNLAGPVTGLLIQPLIIGAIAASICLFAFPYSPELWFAVGLLWILDAGNNTAMEPYRAFVGDKLPDEQLTFGYQMQSLFVGAGITLANFSLFLFQDWFSVPAAEATAICGAGEEAVTAIPRWVYYSFFLGALASIGTVLWSIWKTPEIPPSDEELEEIKEFNKDKPNPLIQILSVIVVLLTLPIILGFVVGYFVPGLMENYNLLVLLILGFALIWIWWLYKRIKSHPDNPRIKKLSDLLAPFIETTDAIGSCSLLLPVVCLVLLLAIHYSYASLKFIWYFQ